MLERTRELTKFPLGVKQVSHTFSLNLLDNPIGIIPILHGRLRESKELASSPHRVSRDDDGHANKAKYY